MNTENCVITITWEPSSELNHGFADNSDNCKQNYTSQKPTVYGCCKKFICSTSVAMIKEKENSLPHMWHFSLGSCRKKCFPITSHCKIFTCAMLSLYKAMIWFIRLVDPPILSCFSEAFTMTREIKNDLLNLQEYLIVGKTSPSSTKVAEEMRSKYQKK